MQHLDSSIYWRLRRRIMGEADSQRKAARIPWLLQRMIDAEDPERERIDQILTELRGLRQHIEDIQRLPDPDRLLSVEEVANLLNVSKRTVQNLAAQGELKPVYVQSVPRYTRASIDAYLRSQTSSRRSPRRKRRGRQM